MIRKKIKVAAYARVSTDKDDQLKDILIGNLLTYIGMRELVGHKLRIG